MNEQQQVQKFYSGFGGLGRDMQTQVFGDWTNHDMNDWSTAAMNYLQHQQDQAYNLYLWNLQNEYNTPAAQMQRYREAGLNPHLAYTQQNAASSPQSSSSPTVSPKNTHSKHIDNILGALSYMNQIVGQVSDISEAFSRNKLRSHQSMVQDQLGALNSLKGEQYRYLLGISGVEPESSLYNSPFAQFYRTQTEAKQSYIDELKAMISLIPDKQAQTQALTELERYRLEIMKGQNDAILNIHTGNDTWDSILRIFAYMAQNMIPSFSISHKF